MKPFSFLSLLTGTKSQVARLESSQRSWPLDLPLVRFSERKEDVWTLRDACQGVLIMGENGSGKTSGSGELLARKYLQAGFGGLVLCFKTDEADLWRAYLKRAGRETDGRYFSVENEFRFNFMDYEARTSGVDFAENLVTLLVDIASVQKRTEASGSEAHFWLPQKKKLIRNAIELLLMAERPIQLRTLYSMIQSAPKDAREAADDNWQSQSDLFTLLQQSEEKARSHPEWELITNYWMRERPALASITLLSRVVDFFRECSVAVGTMSGRSQQPRPDRFEDLLQRQTRSFFLPQGRWLG